MWHTKIRGNGAKLAVVHPLCIAEKHRRLSKALRYCKVFLNCYLNPRRNSLQ